MKTDATVVNELNFLSVVSCKLEKKDYLKYIKQRRNSILAVAKKITGDTQAALKVTKTVFLIGRQNFDHFNNISEFNIWMHKTAATLSIEYRKKSKATENTRP